ncbi:class I SAM-dependent methyltransferase [Paenibacillus thiaminolyticus]|uniref:class I SAM-dependent methyltransferase n=1 Tax=Paenibacillus thiaminolyticus TaxID=49283 RepID=UPI0023302F70|nr:class I SAM-dependent methyltransferase [Paenibacillus thiaminolyticus]WCF10495.1 class I SAM-dependent methyltransferase [Paenibacillus thiaminolyticus]
MEKQKLIQIFDRQANQYDKKREGPKVKQWRQQLLSDAKGEVLELAVGAGANFPFYPPGVQVAAADFSPAMLEKAQRAAREHRLDARFMCADIEELDFAAHSFDTVVSTLSMCSYDQPRMVLEKMKRWCRPDGSILLMEHGISSYRVLSAVQKALNPLLYRAYGCHHTRDIQELMREAGLEILKAESYWLDMVQLVWARPGALGGTGG